MSKTKIKTAYGEINIEDDYGVHIEIDNGERSAAVNLTVEEARRLARILDAFAEINIAATIV